MGTSKSAPNAWMGITGTAGATANNVFAGPGGWYIKYPNGQTELLHGMSGVVEVPVNSPDIDLALNPVDGNYSIGAGDTLLFVINWSEPVVVTGVPQIAFEENSVAKNALYVAASSTSVQSVFEYDVTAEGAVDTVTESIDLNGGTISGADVVAAVLADPVFTDDTMASVAVTSGGGGYTQAEAITIDAPSKANATATITTTAEDPGAVLTVTLVDGGYGYEDGDTVDITGGGSDATVNITVVDGVITEFDTLVGGTGYTGTTPVNLGAPTLTVTQATATPVWVKGLVPDDAGVLTGVILEDGGYGYASGTIAIDGGSSGTVTAVVVEGVIDTAVLLAGGTGYSGTDGVDLADFTIANATATFTTTETGGVLDTIAVVDGGYGYESGDYPIPGGTAGEVTLTVVAGIITVMTLKTAGTGYTAGIGQTFSLPTLTNAIATVTLQYATGVLDTVTMTDPGYGHDGTETVALAAPVGVPAILTFDADYAQPTGIVVVA